MKGAPPTAESVQIICECGRSYTVEGSYNPETFKLRIYHAQCPHCGRPRHKTEVGPDSFRCRKCLVIWKIRKGWKQVDGMDMGCYMRRYRKKKKKVAQKTT